VSESQAQRFVAAALKQDGKPYIFGAETDLRDPSPTAFDCSELVQWAAKQAGVVIPDGSAAQLLLCQTLRTTIAVGQAKLVRGALLFRPGHVAISLGDGRTIEARGAAYGVGTFDERDTWTAGALVPSMGY
jgi:cell wall-associated NlpC family hydrolase